MFVSQVYPIIHTRSLLTMQTWWCQNANAEASKTSVWHYGGYVHLCFFTQSSLDSRLKMVWKKLAAPVAAVFRVCTTLTPPSGEDGECLLFCFKAPILTACENSPSRFKLSANAASITHWHPILWALGTAMPQWNLLWKALNPAQISPLSLLHAHTYTVFKFMSLYSFSPVKKEWSHPLFPVPYTFEFHTLRSEFVPSLEAFH